jgi:peptide deformylase
MSLLDILKYPDPRLKEVSNTVTVFDDELSLLATDMLDTMLSAPGAGLAAPQVGELKRMIVIDNRDDPEEEYGSKVLVLVNPEITRMEGYQDEKEGCLSVMELTANVERAMLVEVKYQDLNGKKHTMEAIGHKAVILQHETDHLDGILFIDHLSPLKRELYIKSLGRKKKESV